MASGKAAIEGLNIMRHSRREGHARGLTRLKFSYSKVRHRLIPAPAPWGNNLAVPA
jgi:hypothetical protein